MKRRMTDTQLESWEEIQESMPEKRARVFAEIRNRGKATEFQVAQALRVPTHYVSGTITRLKDDGLLVDSTERTINPASGRRVILWTLPTKPLPKEKRTPCRHCSGRGYTTTPKQEDLFE